MDPSQHQHFWYQTEPGPAGPMKCLICVLPEMIQALKNLRQIMQQIMYDEVPWSSPQALICVLQEMFQALMTLQQIMQAPPPQAPVPVLSSDEATDHEESLICVLQKTIQALKTLQHIMRQIMQQITQAPEAAPPLARQALIGLFEEVIEASTTLEQIMPVLSSDEETDHEERDSESEEI